MKNLFESPPEYPRNIESWPKKDEIQKFVNDLENKLGGLKELDEETRKKQQMTTDRLAEMGKVESLLQTGLKTESEEELENTVDGLADYIADKENKQAALALWRLAIDENKESAYTKMKELILLGYGLAVAIFTTGISMPIAGAEKAVDLFNDLKNELEKNKETSH